ncbi:hypothetical protein BDZ94DRAFT_1309321 [Collybia nuda]|uniref:Lectin n=1 Tax=Collybia nuda TaxID=64659 RepID=A0A9P6CJG3_9AGAR|nr:hypothetical protein BDZ94DRAFT_1309321 [Collybia nuda]
MRIWKRVVPEELINAFRQASWIWAAGDALFNAPAGLDEGRAFRFTFPSPQGMRATSALIMMTVDNEYVFYVNGNFVGHARNWTTAETYAVNLHPTLNVFAVWGHNYFSKQGGDGPAGVIVAIQITFADGTTSTLSSDESWKAIRAVPDGFSLPSFDDSQWNKTMVLAKNGSGPWGSRVTVDVDSVLSPPPIHPMPISFKLSPTTTSSALISEASSLIAPLTVPVPTASTPITPEMSGPSHSSVLRVPVGIIVGSVVGGIVMLLLIVVLFLWLRARDKLRRRGIDIAAKMVPFDIGPRRPPGYDVPIFVHVPRRGLKCPKTALRFFDRAFMMAIFA